MVFYHPFSIRFYNFFMLHIEHIEEKFPGFFNCAHRSSSPKREELFRQNEQLNRKCYCPVKTHQASCAQSMQCLLPCGAAIGDNEGSVPGCNNVAMCGFELRNI
jgi:hypothetical protein